VVDERKRSDAVLSRCCVAVDRGIPGKPLVHSRSR
jgi:hypothetical protein